jgi:hypothetical protein
MISIIAQLASKEIKVCDLFYYVVIYYSLFILSF